MLQSPSRRPCLPGVAVKPGCKPPPRPPSQPGACLSSRPSSTPPPRFTEPQWGCRNPTKLLCPSTARRSISPQLPPEVEAGARPGKTLSRTPFPSSFVTATRSWFRQSLRPTRPLRSTSTTARSVASWPSSCRSKICSTSETRTELLTRNRKTRGHLFFVHLRFAFFHTNLHKNLSWRDQIAHSFA